MTETFSDKIFNIAKSANHTIHTCKDDIINTISKLSYTCYPCNIRNDIYCKDYIRRYMVCRDCNIWKLNNIPTWKEVLD